LLQGRLRRDVCAKDVMLRILAEPFFKLGKGIAKVLEFAGEGVRDLDLDERATLANMAVEAGGFTGIIEADDRVVSLLAERRRVPASEIERLVVRADLDAQYDATFEFDLSAIPPMIATPGDPRNGIPLAALDRNIAIDIAYGGSCTGGKRADMDMYARVLGQALDKGMGVKPGVAFFLQFGSQDIRRYAESRGYLAVFVRAGAILVDPSCGACIKAGPGASERPTQVTVSAQNRNFPGRSGPGQVYLASPYVVAASAVLGRIGSPAEI
jgi:3-isopropylmalate/(R)-2-methylmalate dehydratase large subunit